MKITDLRLPDGSISFLKSQGYVDLYPPQADSVKAGLLSGKSMLVSAPTASGKTLIATMAILAYLQGSHRKVVYLSPLKALAAEKYGELKKIKTIPGLKDVRIRVSTGDFDSRDGAIARSDVAIMTNEKMDSAIRHDPSWVDEVGLVIVDEIHLLGDQTRGPTLEMILSKLRYLGNRMQVIGLSATISNADEIARWLDTTLVVSDWRPVSLTEGVYDYGTVTMQDGRAFEVPLTLRSPPVDIGVDSVVHGGQSLVFASTRSRSVSLASKAAAAVFKLMKKSDVTHLAKVSRSILERNENTKMIKALADLVKNGVAFHHAGLNQYCREIVEKEFRSGRIKLLTSTPTLAAGVNLPARRVVVSSVTRYDARMGASMPISVMEYKQYCGRAGRPQYDDYGEAIIVGNGNAWEMTEMYVNGEPEPVESQITGQRSLRIHTLSLITTVPGIKGGEIAEFFLNTLGGTQSSGPGVERDVWSTLEFLQEGGLIVCKGGRYAATEFGKKASLLYIDPETALMFRETLRTASKRPRHTLGFLHLITECGEFYPKFGMRKDDYDRAADVIDTHAEEIIDFFTEQECNRSLLALHYWIMEQTDLVISDHLGIESGDMHRMVETAAWLAHSLQELARLQGRADLLEELGILQRRITYGIMEDLTELTRIRGVGRIRARSLFKHKIRTLDDLARLPVRNLAAIDKIGRTIAASIKSQTGTVT